MIMAPSGRMLYYTKPVKRAHTRRPVYSHPKQESFSVRILNLIEQRGGMTAGQIKRQLFEWAHPDLVFDKKTNRGWWSTQLYGHPGLLNHFCKKQGMRWVRNAVPHLDRPWAILKPMKSAWQTSYVAPCEACGKLSVTHIRPYLCREHRGNSMKDLIEALTILSAYTDSDSPTCCVHDELIVCVNPADVSAEDKQRLSELSFDQTSDGNFRSFRFGSA